MSFQSNIEVYQNYPRDDINADPLNSGDVNLVVEQLLDYLETHFPTYNLSSGSAGTAINFMYGYPEDQTLEIKIPVVVIDVRDDDNFVDSMGYLQYYNEDTGTFVRGIRYSSVIELDIWARNPREKKFIEGLLINYLHAGIASQDLIYRGIHELNFVRSIPRGFDETDRVLQFHTHILGNIPVFRQVMEFNVQFESQLVFPSGLDPEENAPPVIQVVDENVDLDETMNYFENVVKQQFTISFT